MDQQIIKIFRTVKLLIGSYAVISWGAIVALIILANGHSELAPTEAWVHGIIIAATALLMVRFMLGMIRGQQNAYLRLRISTAILLAAIIVTSAIPGDFPMWMKLEQGVCGALLIAVVALINGKSMQAAFTHKNR